jgi:hypothetical protein
MEESPTSAALGLTPREEALRQDLAKEYYAILEVVSAFDGRILTVKSWSVTLSLAALGLGFQTRHFGLFGLAVVTAIAFWYIDGSLKGYQMRYYSRMRDIEVAAYNLNNLSLPGLGMQSSPRIDMSWGYHAGRKQQDWRTQAPERRDPDEIRRMMSRRYFRANQLLPHIVAMVLGVLLFLAAVMNSPALANMPI